MGGQRVRRPGRPHPADPRGSTPPTSRVRIHGEALRAVVPRPGPRARPRADRGRVPRRVDARPHGDDPWYAARVTTADEAAKALEIASRLSTGRAGHGPGAARRGHGRGRAAACGCAPPTGAARSSSIEQVRDTLEMFRPEVFDIPLDRLRRRHRPARTTAPGTASSSAGSPGWRLRRQARTLLRPGPAAGRPARRPPATPRSSGRPGRRSPATVAGPRCPPPSTRPSARGRLLSADLEWLGARLAPTAAGGRPRRHPAARPAGPADRAGRPRRPPRRPAAGRVRAGLAARRGPRRARRRPRRPRGRGRRRHPRDGARLVDLAAGRHQRARPALRRPRRASPAPHRRGVRPRRPRPPRQHGRAGARGGRAAAARDAGRPPRPGGAGAGRGAASRGGTGRCATCCPAPARRSPRSSRAGR